MNARPALATAAVLAVAALTACSSPSDETTPDPQAEEAGVQPSPSISDVPSDTSAHPTTSADDAAAAPRPTGGAGDCAPGAAGAAAQGSGSAQGAGDGAGDSDVCTGSEGAGAGTGPAGAQQNGGAGVRTLTAPETPSARDAIVVNLGGHKVTCSLSASEPSGVCTADAAVWPDQSGTARNQATFSFAAGGVDVHDGRGGGGYARTVELAPGETLVAYGFYRVTAGADGLTITTQTPDDGSPADPSVVGKTVRLTADAASYQG